MGLELRRESRLTLWSYTQLAADSQARQAFCTQTEPRRRVNLEKEFIGRLHGE
jgi:hypothetical protein